MRIEVLGTHVNIDFAEVLIPRVPRSQKALNVQLSITGVRTGPQAGHPQIEIPRATGHESPVSSLIKRALAIPA